MQLFCQGQTRTQVKVLNDFTMKVISTSAERHQFFQSAEQILTKF